jgi:hypothetical protein
MPESEQLNRDKYRIIIYHGHMHLMPINEKSKDTDNFGKTQNPNNIIFKKIE